MVPEQKHRILRLNVNIAQQVVLIGDGFAEGLGDWVVMGGMAGAARHLENQAATDDKVCCEGQRGQQSVVLV